jgi:hypothetical protein
VHGVFRVCGDAGGPVLNRFAAAGMQRTDLRLG